MNFTILALLKEGWGKMKNKFFPFIINHRNVIIIAMLLVFIVHQDNLIEEEEDRTEKVVLEFKDYKIQQEQILADAIIKGKEKEAELLNQQIILEREYNEKIKEANRDAISATTTANGLRKQISDNNTKLSNLTNEQVRTYTKTIGDVLETCSGRLTWYAGKADDHRIAEERAVDSYNNLIETYNKE